MLSLWSRVFATTKDILLEDIVVPLEQNLCYDQKISCSGASPSLMESSIPRRSGPLREAGSQEPQIGCVEVPEDELDHAGRKHVVDPWMSLNWLDWSAPFRGRFRAIARLLTSRFP